MILSETITLAVSENCKRLREQRELTLDAAARLTGVSRSMLAQIEKGSANPTISVLWKIANGYKVSFSSLVEDRESAPSILRGAQTEPLREDDGRYLNYPVFPFDERTSFETYRIVIAPGGNLEAEGHMPGTEEYITVFSGTVEIGIDGKQYQLEAGDSIRFRADLPHSYHNTGGETAALSMLIYYG